MAPRSDQEWFQQLWRANVGRLPRGYEPRFNELCRRFPRTRVERAISATANSGFRRTPQRWALFLALFGEAP